MIKYEYDLIGKEISSIVDQDLIVQAPSQSDQILDKEALRSLETTFPIKKMQEYLSTEVQVLQDAVSVRFLLGCEQHQFEV